MSTQAPNPIGPPAKDPKEISTQVLSVRLPSIALRRAFAAKCQEDGISIARWTATVVEAYVDGRLQVIEKPQDGKRPSFLVTPDD